MKLEEQCFQTSTVVLLRMYCTDSECTVNETENNISLKSEIMCFSALVWELGSVGVWTWRVETDLWDLWLCVSSIPSPDTSCWHHFVLVSSGSRGIRILRFIIFLFPPNKAKISRCARSAMLCAGCERFWLGTRTPLADKITSVVVPQATLCPHQTSLQQLSSSVSSSEGQKSYKCDQNWTKLVPTSFLSNPQSTLVSVGTKFPHLLTLIKSKWTCNHNGFADESIFHEESNLQERQLPARCFQFFGWSGWRWELE